MTSTPPTSREGDRHGRYFRIIQHCDGASCILLLCRQQCQLSNNPARRLVWLPLVWEYRPGLRDICLVSAGALAGGVFGVQRHAAADVLPSLAGQPVRATLPRHRQPASGRRHGRRLRPSEHAGHWFRTSSCKLGHDSVSLGPRVHVAHAGHQVVHQCRCMPPLWTALHRCQRSSCYLEHALAPLTRPTEPLIEIMTCSRHLLTGAVF